MIEKRDRWSKPYCYHNNLREEMLKYMPSKHTLEDTGERMVPESASYNTFWEHVYRYRIAARFVRGKRVLDIACGEGYGSAAMLAAGAASVMGIDISEEACKHARRKYQIDARCGSAENIPVDDKSYDVIVSFETIEHATRPIAFLNECARVLTPNGMLIISTPNRKVYREAGKDSTFHCSELNAGEFASLLKERFWNCRFYGQVLTFAPWWKLRSFIAIRSPWRKIRGFGRLRMLAQRVLCPNLYRDAVPRHGQSAVKRVLDKDRPFSFLVNPYYLWEWSFESPYQPVYIIAIASPRKTK